MLSYTPNHRDSKLPPRIVIVPYPAKACFTNNETILYGTHPTNDISHKLAKPARIHHLTMQTRIVILHSTLFCALASRRFFTRAALVAPKQNVSSSHTATGKFSWRLPY